MLTCIQYEGPTLPSHSLSRSAADTATLTPCCAPGLPCRKESAVRHYCLIVTQAAAGLCKQSHALHPVHNIPPTYLLPHVPCYPPHTPNTAA